MRQTCWLLRLFSYQVDATFQRGGGMIELIGNYQDSVLSTPSRIRRTYGFSFCIYFDSIIFLIAHI
jgi:hypothetical protein